MLFRFIALLSAFVFARNASTQELNFSRDVLPILAENCFHCHGPDAGKRAAGLRLDTQEGAFRTKRGITTIVPGKPTESELVRRILSHDADEQMPPPDSQRSLSEKQKTILAKWIESGALWGKHWSFEPRQFTLPAGVGTDGSAILDAFIDRGLKQEGLVKSGEAPPELWLRRVSFDLNGLPPTLAEIDAFIAAHKQDAPAARAAVLTRLLASPRYAERMAVDWLDIARYADTHGYQADRTIDVSPYRDWVLRAFQKNMRFDQFLTEQLAGDLLPNATQQQRLATAFNRLHMQNEEGGVVEEEFRVAYVADRVNTMGTAFMGMTFECCRCHDHKYDPLKQKEYYQLFSFFQNIDESGQTSHFTRAVPVPALMLSTTAQDKAIAEQRDKVADAAKALKEAEASSATRFTPCTPDVKAGLVVHYPFDALTANKLANTVDATKPGTANDQPKIVPGFKGKALELNGDNGATFPGVAHFTKDDSFAFSFSLKVEAHQPRMLILHHSKAPIDAGSRGYDLLLEDGKLAFGLYHMWPGNALKVRTTSPLKVNEWNHIAASYDGSSSAVGITLYINGEKAATDTVRNHLTKDITYGGEEPSLAVGFRFRDVGLKQGTLDEFRIYNRVLTALDAAMLAGRPIPDNDNQQREWYRVAVDKDVAAARSKLLTERRTLTKLIDAIPEIMVMDELPKPKPAFVLKRGAYDDLGDAVTAETPAIMPPFPKDQPRNRLGLARWLTDPKHPLTARVTVNRLWQQMFGKGLVETADNFGTTGTVPSHPELLDWLAEDFIQHGWDIQHTLKLIALSETYRRSSVTTADVTQRDPYNTFLARFPVRRLSAEMLRDQALAHSGLLVEKVGGPSVYPSQPKSVWADVSGGNQYPESKGDNRFRRSLYTFIKRTAPHPQLSLFDAPDRSNCSARRQSTNTPSQALALLNDPLYTQAATEQAKRVLASKTWSLAEVFHNITGRRATTQELAILQQMLDTQTKLSTSNSNAPTPLATIILAIYNLDATVTIR